jgi:hypothetical protein
MGSTAEAVDSMVEVVDSMADTGATDTTAEAVVTTVAIMAITADMVGTSGITAITGITEIIGIMEATGTTGTTGVMDTTVAGGILGMVGVGVIRGTVRTMVTRIATTTAAITAAGITEMATQAVQELQNCHADFHGPGITMVKSMEIWALLRGEPFALTSATEGLDASFISAPRVTSRGRVAIESTR